MEVMFWDISMRQRYNPRQGLPEMTEIPKGTVLIIGGDAPAWRYCQALIQAAGMLHGRGASAIAVFDPKLGAVIIDSHSPRYRAGDTITLEWPAEPVKEEPGPLTIDLSAKKKKAARKKKTKEPTPRTFRTKLRSIKGKYLYSNIKETKKVKKWMDKTGYYRLPEEDEE